MSRAAAPGASPGLVMLYDGLCGFCDRTVQFILKHDRHRRTMLFAALQDEYAHAVLQRHPELAGVDSLIVVERPGRPDESVHVRSGALIRIGLYLGGIWRGAVLLRLVPRVLRDAAYDAFARVRYRWFGRYDACPLPSPEVRARFINGMGSR